MHHGTCVTHVPWCMSESLNGCGGENVSGIPSACANLNFMHLARGPYLISESPSGERYWQTIAVIITVCNRLFSKMALNRQAVALLLNRNSRSKLFVTKQRLYLGLFFLRKCPPKVVFITSWGRVTHICVSNITVIVPGNGLAPSHYLNRGLSIVNRIFRSKL